MITRLDKEQSRKYRRIFLGDIVYITFHDILKAWHKEGHTQLSPVEIALAALGFCKNLLELPDIEEGLEEEMEDLEEEADNEVDAMAIMILASSMLLARSKHHQDLNVANIAQTIMWRWVKQELFFPLMTGGCKKEGERWAQNKQINLMEYELLDIEKNQEGDASIRELIEGIASPTFGKTPETIKESLLYFNKYNIEHNHLYDKSIIKVYQSIEGKASMTVDGGNTGIMTGGNFNANIRFTDQQVDKLISQRTLQNLNQKAIH